jgi:hypothetical protein
MKTCSKCKIEKPLSEFTIDRSAKCGFTSSCTICRKTPKKSAYDVWHGMVERCYNPDNISYKYYGAKGVGVCNEWRFSMETFWSDMGDRPSGTTLDRIDSTKDYCPGNCRWASIVVQNNNKSDTRLITWNGETKSMSVWAKELGMSAHALHYRLTKMRLPVDKAFTIPVTRLARNSRFRKLK